MAANTLVAEVYRDNYGDYRWRLRKGRNILACSGQGYSRRIDCIRGLEVATGSFYCCSNPPALDRGFNRPLIPVRFL